MPNWASNIVIISHKDSSKIASLAQAMSQDCFLDYVIPIPQSLKDTMEVDLKGVALEELTARNIKECGYGDWYNFCATRWGTKWEVETADTLSISDDGHLVEAQFESAWTPPMGVYQELVNMGYDVVGYFHQPGEGYVGKWDNGREDCHYYSNENSQTIRGVIGDELEGMFCVGELLQEYEEDEEDEEGVD